MPKHPHNQTKYIHRSATTPPEIRTVRPANLACSSWGPDQSGRTPEYCAHLPPNIDSLRRARLSSSPIVVDSDQFVLREAPQIRNSVIIEILGMGDLGHIYFTCAGNTDLSKPRKRHVLVLNNAISALLQRSSRALYLSVRIHL